MPQSIAIITGAARGIGLATARLMKSQGIGVALVDRDSDELEKVSGGLGLALPYDVSDPEQVEQMVGDTLRHFGRIDTLVNNAGVADFGPIEETTFDRWRRVMATNLDGVFLCSQSATPALRDSKGSIVNIASISGLRASTLRVAYGTSKAAVMHLTQQQASELGEHGIRVNCVCPGPVRTKLAMAVHSE
ncbi:MAG: SDR family oxidoreductase, partial [Pseudomonadota bacterium]